MFTETFCIIDYAYGQYKKLRYKNKSFRIKNENQICRQIRYKSIKKK